MEPLAFAFFSPPASLKSESPLTEQDKDYNHGTREAGSQYSMYSTVVPTRCDLFDSTVLGCKQLDL